MMMMKMTIAERKTARKSKLADVQLCLIDAGCHTWAAQTVEDSLP